MSCPQYLSQCGLTATETEISSGDICQDNGWYGNGICDERCAQPDPDCMDFVGEELNCHALWGCLVGCSDDTCSQQCFARSSLESAELVNQLAECVVARPEDFDWSDPEEVQRYCPLQAVACFN